MRLLIIAKAPQPGHSKTRLTPPCTPVEAAMLAEAALVDTLEAALAVPGAETLLVLDGDPGPWLPNRVPVIVQRGRGLDDRIAAAFEDAGGPAFLVGMDTPQLTPSLLTYATERLMAPGVDCVLGAAEDGGWWGIGLRSADPRAFLHVPMSTDTTAWFQRRSLAALGLVTHELPMLRDVDLFEDALAVAADAPGTNFARALNRVDRMVSVEAHR